MREWTARRHTNSFKDTLSGRSRAARRFETALATDPAVAAWLSQDELSSLFDPVRQLQYVDAIFARLGLDQGERHLDATAASQRLQLEIRHIP